jgi:glycosyltransferase involved in cell wall biosynthesis
MTPFDPVTEVRGLKVAYLVNQYPKVSHTFIRREILALERQGVDVLRLAVRGWDAELVDAEDAREQERTRYALQGGIGRLIPAALRMALRSPGRFLAALRLALKMGRRADRPWPYHLAYLAEACWVAPRLSAAGARHLHAHFGTNPAEVAMLASILSGVSYSFTVHGADEADKPEFLGLGEKIRRSAFVVAVSSFGRSQIMRWAGQDHWHKVKVVRCGLEPAFHDVAPVAMPDRPRLICVGRLCGEKGQLLLLDAVAALARDGVEFELVLAGDGEMRAQVEAAIARYGLGRRVHITGWLSSAQVRAEIQAAKALVLPSFIEGLPVVIMEAMALRRPILATYVAGIPELVVHGENGWLVPAGAADELAAAIKACLATPSEVLVRMGNLARERVLARHDADREAARLAGFFREATQLPRQAGVPS